MAVAPYHTPVLLREALHYLHIDRQGIYVDATLGGGGHSEAILWQLRPGSRLIGIDADRDAIGHAEQRLRSFGDRFTAVQANFRDLGAVLAQVGVSELAGVLFDLGVSSHQIDELPRGFSYQGDGPLDMRMDPSKPLTAGEILNTYEVRSLERIFEQHGEERMARRIARAVDRRRQRGPFALTSQLVETVAGVAGGRFLTKTLARVFQALRIEVNAELDTLRSGLEQAVNSLRREGVLVVISYHSLEDRIVKTLLVDLSRRVRPMSHPLAPPEEIEPTLEILTRKPVVPGSEEISTNPRARSAKLRAARKITGHTGIAPWTPASQRLS